MHVDYRTFFMDVHNAPPQDPKWIIKDVLPVGLQIIGAPPKNFKSTLANALPTITSKWGNTVLPKWASLMPQMGGPSVILSGDATVSEIKWLFNKGFNYRTTEHSVYINDDPWDFKLDNPAKAKVLKDILEEVQPRILMIDPFRKFHSGDENDATYIENLLYPWRKWAIYNEAAVILVHHTQKDSVGATIEDNLDPARLRGSGVLFANADSVLMCRCINRFLGIERVSAIHKRGTPWDRTFNLGVPGYGDNWAKIGNEALSDLDVRVLQLTTNGCASNKLAAQLHVRQSEVDESLAKLERNK